MVISEARDGKIAVEFALSKTAKTGTAKTGTDPKTGTDLIMKENL